MIDGPTQNDLARERTHAAWIRTCLAFLVAAVALRNYSTRSDELLPVLLLVSGGVVSALRAAKLAPDLSTMAIAWALVGGSISLIFIQI